MRVVWLVPVIASILILSIIATDNAFAPKEKTLESECAKKENANDFDTLLCEAVFAVQAQLASLTFIQTDPNEPVLELQIDPQSTAPALVVTDGTDNLFAVNNDGSIQIGPSSVVIFPDGAVTGPLSLQSGSTVGGFDIIDTFEFLDKDIDKIIADANDGFNEVFGDIDILKKEIADLFDLADFQQSEIILLDERFTSLEQGTTSAFDKKIETLTNVIVNLFSKVTALEQAEPTTVTFYEVSETFDDLPFTVSTGNTHVIAVLCDAGDTVVGGGAINNLFTFTVFDPVFGDDVHANVIFFDNPFPSVGTSIGWEANVFPDSGDILFTFSGPHSFTVRVICADTALPAHTP